MRAATSVTCEVIGGPRDGDLIVVPGNSPPQQLRVIMTPDASRLLIWHPAAAGLPDLREAYLVTLELDYNPHRGALAWRYLWPQGG